jgi:hypothetical protein
MRKNKDEKICSRSCLYSIGNSNDTFWKLDSRQIFDVFVLFVDDLCQVPPIDL